MSDVSADIRDVMLAAFDEAPDSGSAVETPEETAEESQGDVGEDAPEDSEEDEDGEAEESEVEAEEDEAEDDEAEDAEEDDAEEDQPQPSEIEQLRRDRDALLWKLAQLEQVVKQGQQQKAPGRPTPPPVQLGQPQQWLHPSSEAEAKAAELFHAMGSDYDATEEGKKVISRLGLSSDQVSQAKRMGAQRQESWRRYMSDPRAFVMEHVTPIVQQYVQAALGPIQAERDAKLLNEFYQKHDLRTQEERTAVYQLVSQNWHPEAAAIYVKRASEEQSIKSREQKVKRRERDQETRKRGRRRAAGKRPRVAKKSAKEFSGRGLSASELIEQAYDQIVGKE